MALIRAANDLGRLRLDDAEFLDLNGKLAILTVIAGQKPAFAQGLWDDPVSDETRDGLSSFAERWDLELLTTGHPPLAPVDGIPEQVTKELEALKLRGDVLWLSKSKELRSEAEEAASGEVDVGLVLGYPSCCVDAHRERDAEHRLRFHKQLMKQYRPRDEAALLQLIREDPPIEVPGRFQSLDETVGRSYEQLPFISHTACRACLDEDSSPSRNMNERHRSVAEEAGAYFFRQFLAAQPSSV